MYLTLSWCYTLLLLLCDGPMYLQPLKDLPLPVVATDSVVVRYADQRCYPPNTPASLLGGSSATAAAAAAGVDGEALAAGSAAAVWEQLEQLLAGGEVPSTNWLDGAKQVRLVREESYWWTQSPSLR